MELALIIWRKAKIEPVDWSLANENKNITGGTGIGVTIRKRPEVGYLHPCGLISRGGANNAAEQMSYMRYIIFVPLFMKLK